MGGVGVLHVLILVLLNLAMYIFVVFPFVTLADMERYVEKINLM